MTHIKMVFSGVVALLFLSPLTAVAQDIHPVDADVGGV